MKKTILGTLSVCAVLATGCVAQAATYEHCYHGGCKISHYSGNKVSKSYISGNRENTYTYNRATGAKRHVYTVVRGNRSYRKVVITKPNGKVVVKRQHCKYGHCYDSRYVHHYG